MRVVPFAIGSTDAVHVYSEVGRIQLQLRRDVPTEASIAKPSFKVALTLTPDQAIAVATELLTATTRKTSQSNGIAKPISPKTVAK
jgi:hypothetical protein